MRLGHLGSEVAGSAVPTGHGRIIEPLETEPADGGFGRAAGTARERAGDGRGQRWWVFHSAASSPSG
jgi:hypothetical protein